jgi:hypothetical protein
MDGAKIFSSDSQEIRIQTYVYTRLNCFHGSPKSIQGIFYIILFYFIIF